VRAHGFRVLWAHGNNKQPRKQIFACVPHANGFFGLLHVPGVVTCADAPRSCELSPGHALGPSARRAGVGPRTVQGPQSLTWHKVRHRSGHPHPVATSRRRSRRAPYRSGMAGTIIVLSRNARTKEEHPPPIFSENQKEAADTRRGCSNGNSELQTRAPSLGGKRRGSFTDNSWSGCSGRIRGSSCRPWKRCCRTGA
jgi:hypothetical protein